MSVASNMGKTRAYRLLPRAVALGMAAAAIVLLQAAAAHAERAIGQIKNVSGDAQIVRNTEVLPVAVGLPIRQSDVVQTGPNGKLGMTFIDNSTFSVGPNSELALERFRFNTTTHEGEFRSDLKKGTLAVISGKLVKQSSNAMTVRTPSLILGVRGTKFLVEVGE